jgi:hypothetical protein
MRCPLLPAIPVRIRRLAVLPMFPGKENYALIHGADNYLKFTVIVLICRSFLSGMLPEKLH